MGSKKPGDTVLQVFAIFTLPPLQLFEELENQEYVLAPYESFWKAHFTRVVESVLDVVHLSFVHKDSSVHLDD
ncbi:MULTISPECIES: hypothetical protein [Fictibacillus]|uniref:Uncharacterized protein n=1 Tax=Fictibacillus enclensis TaxID=1017270 RepID=A0A0V8JCJ3_9BACL|nr:MULTISPECIES: hypothetical protein [Fictibacillus]KSU84634.1 hypothetical protein AS030_03610 [Fictibacillus enclensis]RXY99713.1 hypothetical protein DMO16_08470 [Fictibacillus sp. S7]